MTKRTKISAQEPESEERRVSELEGHLELGMKEEALKCARKFLKSNTLTAPEFQSAVGAILIQADNLKPWQRLVEQAYARLRKSDQRTVRFHMLAFSASGEDWKRAANFIPKNPEMAADLLFSMRACLHLKDLKQAKSIRRKCQRMLASTSDPTDCSTLLEALASYHAGLGELDLATKCWEASAGFEPFFHEAQRGLIKIQAVRGQYYVAGGLERIQRFKESTPDENAIMLPKNRDGCFEAIERDLKVYQKALERIVPANELWQFGVQSEGDDQAA